MSCVPPRERETGCDVVGSVPCRSHPYPRIDAADVSVVIPAYNAAPFIGRAIRSVRAQTQQPREIVVVDDGSRDGTVDSVREIDPSIAIVRQPNLGPGAARNRGVRLATAEFVCFLDADDEYEPAMISTLFGALRRFPNADVASAAYHWEFGGILDRHPPASQTIVEGGCGLVVDFFAVSRRGSFVNCDSVMVRKRAFEAVGGFREDVRFGEDVDLWDRLAGRYEWVFVDTPVCIYHQAAATSATLRTPESSMPGDLLLNEERMRRYVRPELWKSYRLYRRDWLCARARAALGRDAPARARALLGNIAPARPSLDWMATWVLAHLPRWTAKEILTMNRRIRDGILGCGRRTAGRDGRP